MLYIILYYILYINILYYYTYTILYPILYSSFPPSPHPLLLLSSLLLFFHTLLLIFPYNPPLPLFLSYPIPSHSSHSFYTCRYLDTLIYVHLSIIHPSLFLLSSILPNLPFLFRSILIQSPLPNIQEISDPACFIGGMSRVV